MARRTMYYDKQWMEALDKGVKQFVILASGMDSRAWRLPNLNGCTVFEIDVPQCHTFKRSKIPLLDMYELSCTRVEVEADLSDPAWSETTRSCGFDPSQKSFFLMEGLTMYLPEGATESRTSVI